MQGIFGRWLQARPDLADGTPEEASEPKYRRARLDSCNDHVVRGGALWRTPRTALSLLHIWHRTCYHPCFVWLA